MVKDARFNLMKLSLVKALPVIYRVLALAIAIFQLNLSPFIQRYLPVSVALLIGVVTGYTILKIIFHFTSGDLNRRNELVLSDIVFCAGLVFISGGIYSPFLLYTISPVIFSALKNRSNQTFIISVVSIVYVIISHITNPFTPRVLMSTEISYLAVYIIAVVLAGILPYITNINQLQRIQSESIIQERNRLSRELHDGLNQTLAVLHWQSQLIERKLNENDLHYADMKQIKDLIIQAQSDAREAMKALHTNADSGSLLPMLNLHLNNISSQNSIKTSLDTASDSYSLSHNVEAELIRVCQEALVNVRKHSQARQVRVKLREIDGYLETTISDDGKGFDYNTYLLEEDSQKGFGLAVMRERAESIGGALEIWSSPGKGTIILARVPCAEHKAGVIWQRK